MVKQVAKKYMAYPSEDSIRMTAVGKWMVSQRRGYSSGMMEEMSMEMPKMVR